MTNPQNPYASYIVKASAGSGKTFHLSRRFLYLVAAGSEPDAILTITFTKKAANEMRERILEDAADLLKNSEFRQEFDLQMMTFFQNNHSSHPPRSAKEVAQLILSKTQSLQITTIDSIFLDWVAKFPLESKGDRSAPIPARLEVSSPTQERFISRMAWQQTCQQIYDQDNPFTLNPKEIYQRIDELQKNETLFWLCEKLLGNALKHQPVPALPDHIQDFPALIREYRESLLTIAQETKKYVEYAEAIHAGDVSELIRLRLLTKDLNISGSTIRGKKREKLADEIFEVEEAFRNFDNAKKIKELNEDGEQLAKIFRIFMKERERIKSDYSVIDFSDMSKCCHNLFDNPEAFGAQYLIRRRTNHLLLDEFQDTSRLQWAIFRSIAQELLAGEGFETEQGSSPTVFIVGDEKQSIYGFREADVTILNEAAEELATFGAETIQLNHSYRTSQGILDLVNGFFQDRLPNFGNHQTAEIGNQPFIPNFGKIAISPLFDDKNCIRDEAVFVAGYIKDQVESGQLEVYDKKSKTHRKISFSDCAVLYRSSTHTEAVERELRALGIDSIREESKGFFSRPEIVDFIHCLKFLYQKNDMLSFLVLLRSPLSPLSESEFIETTLRHQREQVPFGLIDRFLQKAEAAHPEFVNTVRSLLRTAADCSPADLVFSIIDGFSAVKAYRANFGDYEGKLAEENIRSFLELSYEWQSRSGHSLGRFLQVVEELAAEDSIGSSQSSGNAVQLMTIHKSKGLEFPLVVVMGLGEAWEKEDPYWLKIQNGDDAGFYYVGKRNQQPLGHSFFDQLRTRGKDNDARENERLLYVALTRAKHHLLLTGSRRADSKKKLGYWQHLKSCFEAQWQEASLNHWNYQSFEINSPWSSPSAAEAARVPDGPLLDRFPKSPSVSINKDLLTLAPARLLQSVPQEQESLTHLYAPYSQEVGLFIHELLEFAMEGRTCEPKALWEKYYKGMERERFDKIGSLAVRTTEAVYRHPIWNVFQDSLAIRCEQAVVHLHGNQLIRGSIDLLLERRPSHYLVVDYKTIPLPASSPYQQIIQEHRYDQQILAYIRAIKAMHPLAKVNGAVLFTHSQKLCLTHEEFEDQALIGQDTILRDSNHFQPELD